jgi:hypothetical protein
MLKIKFRYKDRYTAPGKWSEQECVVDSVKDCIEIYGLDQPDVEYQIVSIKEVDHG